MQKSCEVIFPIIAILGDIKAHRMTCPTLKVMSAPGLESMASGLSGSKRQSFPYHSGDHDASQNGDYTVHCFLSKQHSAGQWNKIVFKPAYLSLLVMMWLKPNKEFILYSFPLRRLILDKLLRRTWWREVHINSSEVLVTHILHFLFFPTQFWLLSSLGVQLPGR